jgi:hypothetical protein
MRKNYTKHRKTREKKPKSSSNLQAFDKNEKKTPQTREKTPKSS